MGLAENGVHEIFWLVIIITYHEFSSENRSQLAINSIFLDKLMSNFRQNIPFLIVICQSAGGLIPLSPPFPTVHPQVNSSVLAVFGWRKISCQNPIRITICFLLTPSLMLVQSPFVGLHSTFLALTNPHVLKSSRNSISVIPAVQLVFIWFTLPALMFAHAKAWCEKLGLDQVPRDQRSTFTFVREPLSRLGQHGAP